MLRRIFSLKNLHTALIVRILIVAFLFFLCRILFYLFNASMFPGLSVANFFLILITGFRFDMSAIVIINLVFLIMFLLPIPWRTKRAYQLTGEIIFYLVNGLALIACCADIIYYRFSLKHSTADIFKYLSIGGGNDFFTLLPKYLADFWYIFLIWILLVALMIFLYQKTKKGYNEPGNKLMYYLKHILYIPVFFLFMLLFARGGFQYRPISMISAGENVTSEFIPLVLNTPFTLIQTAGKEQIETRNYFSSEASLNAVYTPVHHFTAPKDSTCHLNVVVFILESFSKEYMGLLNHDLNDGKYKGYTPFLDSLANEGLLFTNAFANSKRSIEGIPAILASLPNLTENPFITSSYADDNINGLPELLKKYGYTSGFFHGGTNGTMRFDAFASIAGFDKYYGRNEYNNEKDFDGKWGIFDEPYLQYTANKLNQMKQPFCIVAYTLSSHHPYTVPEKYKGRFSKGKLPIHESIQYTDYALKRFFMTASKMSWYKNTLFVFTPDHSSMNYYPYYQNCVGELAIPIIFYRPDGSLKGQNKMITQQTDIVPSILNYLNYSGDFISFGESVFDTTAKRFSVCYFNNIYQLIYKGLMIQFNGENTLAVYDLEKDPMLLNNLRNRQDKSYSEAESLIKAIIQSYSMRMNENKLVVK